MKLSLALYLTNLVHNIDDGISICLILYISSFLGIGFFWLITNDGYSKDANEKAASVFNKVCKKGWIPLILFVFSIIIPSQQTMYLILGSEFLSSTHLPSKVTEALELKLDDVIKDLAKKKKEN